MSKQNSIMLLFQLADSAFPIGGFAYSSGMESALKQGFILNIEDLRNYLSTFAEQVISFDFPFICSGFNIDPEENNFAENVKMLQQAYCAMLLNPPIQRASSITGINWMKILRQLSLSNNLHTFEKLLSDKKSGSEFPVIFGLSMKAAGFDLNESLNLFFYMTVRDQMSAMIRLSIAGPSMAHRELKDLTAIYAKKIAAYNPTSYHQAVKSGYLLDLVQLTHHRVYSKLFQN